MLRIIAIISVLIVVAQAGVPRSYSTSCQKHGIYYKYYATKKNEAERKKACANDGGIVADPLNDAQAKCLITYLRSAAKGQAEFAAIGLKRYGGKKLRSLRDNSGRSFMTGRWDSGEPGQGSGEDCVGVTTGGPRFKGKHLGTLHDLFCHTRHQFVCSIESKVPAGYNGCCSEFGVYYKYHSGPQDYATSQQKCHQEGGRLADLKSAAEANCLIGYLRDAAAKHGEFTYVNLKRVGNSHGLKVSGGRARSHMERFWDVGQPDKGLKEDCVGFTTGGPRYAKASQQGKLHDLFCYNRRGYVCEYRP